MSVVLTNTYNKILNKSPKEFETLNHLEHRMLFQICWLAKSDDTFDWQPKYFVKSPIFKTSYSTVMRFRKKLEDLKLIKIISKRGIKKAQTYEIFPYFSAYKNNVNEFPKLKKIPIEITNREESNKKLNEKFRDDPNANHV
jgi:hypothetical protein